MSARRSGVLVLAVLAALSCSDDATSGSIASLRFAIQPGDIIAGQPVTVSVEFTDASGHRVSTSDEVTIATTASGVDGRTFSARSGVAFATDYVVKQASDNQVLVATARGLRVVSLPFRVSASAADGAMSAVATNASESLLSNTAREVVFTFADRYGNRIPRAEVSVSSDVNGATFTPTGGKTGVDGTFRTSFRPPAIGTARFTATVNGLPISIAQPLTIGDACASSAAVVPGLISGRIVRGQGCTVGAIPMQFYQFTTITSGGFSMNFRPTFLMSAELRANPLEGNVPLVISDTSVIRQFLLPAGTYQLRIGAFSDDGPYTVTTTTTPANRGDTIRILALPGTYTGQTLAQGDFLNSVDGYTDAYAIFSTRPCTITARSTSFDTYLSLTNSFGLPVGVDDNSGGGTDAQITRTSCTSNGGAIRIDVTTAFSGQGGPYTLIIAFN